MKPSKGRRPLEEMQLAAAIQNINRKKGMHKRESSVSSYNSNSSHKRTNSSACESKTQLPIKARHKRTVSSYIPLPPPSVQEEISNTVNILKEKFENEKEKLEVNRKNIKDMLRKVLITGENSKTPEELVIKQKVKNKVKKIIKFFIPALKPDDKLDEICRKKLKTYFVAISKEKAFAIYSKDAGGWKKIYGDESIKISKNTPGTKLKFVNNTVQKIKPGENYNLFVLK